MPVILGTARKGIDSNAPITDRQAQRWWMCSSPQDFATRQITSHEAERHIFSATQNPLPADRSLLHLPTPLVNPAAERLGKAVDVIDTPSANNSVSHMLHLSAKIPLSALLHANLFSRMHSGTQNPSLLFRNPRSYEIHSKARV